jgi:hypothetical protein
MSTVIDSTTPVTPKLVTLRHPTYDENLLGKYRLVYEGGQEFIEVALKRYVFERTDIWTDRRALAYNPAFGEEAVGEYARAILQYQNDVIRVGGNPTYLACCRGELGGVDGQGSSMNSFIGRYVISELLAMGKVGIYVDNHKFMGTTLADTYGHPYMYAYKAEDILNWSFIPGHPDQLRAVLLRDNTEVIDPVSQLPYTTEEQFRHIYLDAEGYCHVDFYDLEGTLLQYFKLDIKVIPFILVQITHSLLKNVCDYQAALLNLSSSTFFYAWQSNFPFYVEQYDPMYQDRYFETRTNDNPPDPESTNIPGTDNYSDMLDSPNPRSDKDQITVGSLSGRRYVKGINSPAFINPSSEPMTASMSKEQQLKEEIRQLVALNVSSLTPKMASAESKALDREGLEGGLNFIGLTLELMERRSAFIWHAYSGNKDGTKITYPESYTLLTEQDRRSEAKELKDLQHAVPSPTYQKKVCKKIASVMFGGAATPDEMKQMDLEIENSKVPTADPTILQMDHEAGFVSTATASQGRGYPAGESEKAAIDQALRLARIKDAQSPGVGAGASAGARGVADESVTPIEDAREEKRLSQVTTGGRGPAQGET